jgi:hypothetical protein
LGVLAAGGSKEERAQTIPSRSALAVSHPSETMGVLMTVIIGVDPHKASHTAVAIDRSESELDRTRVRATRKQASQLLAWAEPLGKRTWAIESAGGLGYLLAQQLVDAGETVLDVPATLVSRVRVLGTGRSDKTDPNDALSVAIAALRAPALREVRAADHAEVLRLLAKRNIDIGSHRTRVVCRLHNVLMELAAGGIAKELNASDAIRLLEQIEPATPIEQARHDLAVEFLADVQRLDTQLKESHRRIRMAVQASGTTVTDIFGIGPGDRLLSDRLHRRRASLHQPRSVRRVQRHRTRGAILRRPRRAPPFAAREPATQPRVASRRDLPDPPDPL